MSKKLLTADTQVYSSDEVFTGKTWIDGKKIYRKCGKFSGQMDGTNQATLMSVNNVDTPVYLIGWIKEGDNYILMPYPNPASFNGSMSIYYNDYNKCISAYSKTSHTSYSGYVVFEYTKTTD